MKTQLTLSMLAVATLLATQSVSADLAETNNDWKGYNGAFCKPSNSQLDVRSTLSGIANWEDRAVTIYCPIVRDKAEGGPDNVNVSVRLFNNNGSRGGYCTLVSRNINNAVTVDFDRRSWPGGYSNRTIRLGPVDANNWGSYMVYCRLPAAEGARKSFIRSIAADERS